MTILSKIFLTIALVFSSFLFFAQQTNTCTIKGQLIDETTQLPISGALISDISGNSQHEAVTTDHDGNFMLITASNLFGLHLDKEGYDNLIIIPSDACGKSLVYKAKPTTMNIGEVMVTGFRDNTQKIKVAASIGYISKETIEGTDQTSIQNAINTIPGVIMESRGYGGSARISIRGSALRSPFAVRNVKMYLDGIPLTSPDGQAPLELMDASDISSLEVIKGPAGSVWGSGNGGVLLFKSKKALPGKTRYGTSFQAGSYNSFRTATFAEIGLDKGGIRVSYVWQDNQGYRMQEFNHKNQVSLTYNYHITNKQSILVYGTYYSGNWGLPGALTSKQVGEDPKQAVKFSLDNNAKLVRERLMGGVSHTIRFNSAFKETTSAYYYSTDKSNPYGTSAFNSGYKNEGADGFGGRTDWSYEKKVNNAFSTKVNFGGEWQSEKFNIIEDKIVNGFPSDFKYAYDIGYITSMAFLSADFTLKELLTINLGASINNNVQHVKGFTSDGFNFDRAANWKSQILPRLAATFRLKEGMYIFRSVSTGNANPTVFEMIDYQYNLYNLALRPENGINHELGIRQNVQAIHLNYELSYYQFKLTDAILSYPRSLPNDGPAEGYSNAGSTNQKGLEWSCSWAYQPDHKYLSATVYTSGSAFYYTFGDYKIDDVRYNGNSITGVPKFNVNSGISITALQKIHLDIMHYWYDKMPLNNSNTVWSSAYHLINARLSFNREIKQKFQVGVYVGVNNLLNTKYTSNYSLNATGGKYYNPSAPLNSFVGFNVTYMMRDKF